jgi:hypothetical protein
MAFPPSPPHQASQTDPISQAWQSQLLGVNVIKYFSLLIDAQAR